MRALLREGQHENGSYVGGFAVRHLLKNIMHCLLVYGEDDSLKVEVGRGGKVSTYHVTIGSLPSAPETKPEPGTPLLDATR